MVDLNLAGAVINEALIIRVAERARVDRVLTFNVDDFRWLWPEAAAKIAQLLSCDPGDVRRPDASNEDGQRQ